jgi:hypothetical protein
VVSGERVVDLLKYHAVTSVTASAAIIMTKGSRRFIHNGPARERS